MHKKPTKSTPILSHSPRYGPLSEVELKRALIGDVPSKPLSKIELSQWLGTTTRFLENEVRDGRLRSVRIGRRSIRFLPSDVSAWLNARSVTALGRSGGVNQAARSR
jgi:excisionase family DNA binding protein